MSFAPLSVVMRLLGVAGFAIAIAACSHPVRISPQLTLPRDESRLIDARVGYQITATQRSTQVTSAGGGGDKISYYPYRDLESALYETLASVFAAVFVVPDVESKAFINEKQLRFVFTPAFETSSSSSNVFFWNPTDFTVQLTATAFDASGAQVWTRMLSGVGKAPAGGTIVETPSAQLAAIDVFVRLQRELLLAREFRE